MRYNEIIESLSDDDLFGNKWTPWDQLGFHEDDEFHMTELGFTWGEDPEQDVRAINSYLSQYSDAFDFRISAVTGQESDNSLKVVVRKDLDENDDDDMFGEPARFKLSELAEIYCHRYQDLMHDATDKHYRDEFEETFEDFDAMIGAFRVSMEAGIAILKQMENEDAFSEFAEEAEDKLGINLGEYLGENELAPVDQSDTDLFGNSNRVWEVYLWMNRWDGRYYDFAPYPVNVPGASAGDALIWMKMNQDKVLHWLDNFRIGGTTRKRRLVKAPAGSNVFFDQMRVHKELPEGTPLSRPARPGYEI